MFSTGFVRVIFFLVAVVHKGFGAVILGKLTR